jgi:hypothetical protein
VATAIRNACSFDGGTLVQTDNGFVPIEDIVPGRHQVLSRNKETGEVDFKPVIYRYSNVYDDVVHITIRDLDTLAEQTILSNRIHGFFAVERSPSVQLVSEKPREQVESDSGGRWVQAQHLKKGQLLTNSDEGWSEIVAVEVEARTFLAYNLNVADFHTYFVKNSLDTKADAVWVNNCRPTLSEEIVRDVARLGGEHSSINAAALRSDAFSVINTIAGAVSRPGFGRIPRTTQDLRELFPDQRVHELIGNLRGWTSIDPVPGNAHAHAGVRILARREGHGWLFRVTDTH